MRVVVLGGGYAAIWCCRALRRHAPAVDVTVVAPHARHAFHGFTGEVLDGGLRPQDVESPLDACLPGVERIVGSASAVDSSGRTVTVTTAAGDRVLAYDQLVVATGAADRTEHVPGLAEHGWALRAPGRTAALLQHLEAHTDAPAADAAEAERRRTVVVAGGGLAGVEAAAALGRRYGEARRVVLLSSSSAPVPQWATRAGLQRRLQRNLEDAGVEVRTGARVVRVDAGGADLADGGRIASATVVGALGSTVPLLPGLEGFREDDGLLRVDEHLRVADGVWAAGDVAAVHHRGHRVAKEAMQAVRAGDRVGRNIARAARGAAPRRFDFDGLGTAAGFAPGRSVVILLGVPLPQRLGWLVRAGFFLWYVPSRRTALGIVRRALTPRTVLAPARVRTAAPARPALTRLTGGLGPLDVEAVRRRA